MGMYTEIVVSGQFDFDEQAVEILQYMLGMCIEEPKVLPAHELFSTERWRYMLRCSSYYHVPRAMHLLEFDDIGREWCFIVRSDFKDYGCESVAFFDWINNYYRRHSKQMIGYTLYEENRDPIIYYGREADE